MTLDNYDGLTDPMEHVHNMQRSLKLVIQDSYTMCKIFPIIFKGSVRVWYNNLKSSSITSFSDLCTMLMAWFNTSILIKNSFIELYRITQVDNKSTRAYLKKFNKKMLKVEELIEFMASKALISKVKGKAL